MDKQEAKQKLHNITFAKMNTRPDDSKLADVMQVIDQIDEPEKPVIPQFMADWIEYCKSNKLTLLGAFEPVSEHGIGLANTFTGQVWKCVDWAKRNQETFARAWLFGYEVEKEKLYTVKLKANDQVLSKHYGTIGFVHSSIALSQSYLQFSKSDIEQAGFGWVFDCDGVKVVEE